MNKYLESKFALKIKAFVTSPLSQLSLGLVMLTATMLFTSEFFGLIPDTKQAELESRKTITETLAVQLSLALKKDQLDTIEESLHLVVDRNDNILSGAVRKNFGGILYQFGDHEKNWSLKQSEKSSTNEIQVSLFNGAERWGSVELRYNELGGGGSWLSFRGSFIFLVLFIIFSGFIAYRIFLKRALKELDPDAVIPDRVRKALDTLSEGLLIIDNNNTIIFSNLAFAQKTGYLPEQLIGKDSTEFGWEINLAEGDIDDNGETELPWISALNGEEIEESVRIKLNTELHATYIFNVNVSPITADDEAIKGALITFDDVTEIEMKNEELRQSFEKLEESQREIMQQNKELLTLATRDPLTNLLNRRSLFEGFDSLLQEAHDDGTPLSCIMVDIDHFKLVNDNYGHSIGDVVIKLLGKILEEHAHADDLVGRLGGEEFVVVLPNVEEKDGAQLAERMRLTVAEINGDTHEGVPQIYSSFGVSTLTIDIKNANELLELADKALYAAKETGRNRVICYSDDMYDGALPEILLNSSEEDPAPRPSNVRGGARDEDKEVLSFLVEKEEEKPVSCPPDKVLLLERINRAITRVEKYQTKVAILSVDIDALRRVNDTLGIISAEKFAKTIVARIKDTLRNVNAVELTDQIEAPDQTDPSNLTDQTDIVEHNLSDQELSELQELSSETTGELSNEFSSKQTGNIEHSANDELPEKTKLSFSVSRFNSHEIVVLLTDLDQSTLITSFLYSIFSANEAPITVDGNEFYLNTNIGVSMFPSNGDDPDSLLRNSSSAMQEAKRKLGRNNFEFYTDEIGEQSKKIIQMENELHRALERNEFSVHYQPKVSLSDGTIAGMEALLRWEHPQLGFVPPDEFIPIAEQTGLINQISQWLIRTVCRQVKFWQDSGFETASVSLNLSPSDFRSLDLADQIISEVRNVGLSPEFLEFEITETVVMHSVEATLAILDKLSQAGFTIVLDDFGTGYSSLSYLKKFPVSKIKIDSSFIKDFVKDSHDATIVSTLISMSHSLDLKVVAEGVETEDQLHFLQDLHCDEVQGYLFGPAVPTDKASEIWDDSSNIQRMILDHMPDNVIPINAIKTGTE